MMMSTGDISLLLAKLDQQSDTGSSGSTEQTSTGELDTGRVWGGRRVTWLRTVGGVRSVGVVGGGHNRDGGQGENNVGELHCE